MIITQALLAQGCTRMRVLLEGPSVRPGQRVTLKGEPERWDVVEVGQPIRRDGVKRGWNNNI